MSGQPELERSDFLFALQYACDLAKQAGDDEFAKEMATAADSDLEEIFRIAQYLVGGLQIRKAAMGLPS